MNEQQADDIVRLLSIIVERQICQSFHDADERANLMFNLRLIQNRLEDRRNDRAVQP